MQADEKVENAYRELFGSPTGQLVLSHLLHVCHAYESSYKPGDPHETTFREGERHIAMLILRLASVDEADRNKRYAESRSILHHFYGQHS